jgi:hypothetical protein
MMKLSNKPFDIFSLSVLNPSSILWEFPLRRKDIPSDAAIVKLQWQYSDTSINPGTSRLRIPSSRILLHRIPRSVRMNSEEEAVREHMKVLRCHKYINSKAE